jgi:hypothetical protein
MGSVLRSSRMKKDTSAVYRFHLRMWQATDPYSADVEGACREDAPDTLPEERVFNAVVNVFRRAASRAAQSRARRTPIQNLPS